MNYEEFNKSCFEKAKRLYKTANADQKHVLENLFPELNESEESENEKIRKNCIHFLELQKNHHAATFEIDECIAWLENQKDCIKLSDSAYTSNKDVIKFADKYSHTVWEKLMDKFKKIKNYSIGCNDVSDIVLNAIINTYNWLEKQGQKETTWNKEDEENMNNVLFIFNQLKNTSSYKEDDIAEKTINWFKSIKDRLCSNNECDKDMLGAIEYCIKNNRPLEKEHISWLETQSKNKPVISDDALREGIAHFGITQYQIDNWLKKYIDIEKQGEQKPTDKVKPKFKVGDWITNGRYVRLIVGINSDWPYYMFKDGTSKRIEDIDKKYYLWTIQDAKDGDVLYCNVDKDEIGGDIENLPNITPTICIYQNVVKDKDYTHTYCSLHNKSSLVLSNSMYYNTFVYNIHPATKEQCDILFQKIKEAGCEWDAEKKELVKIKNDDDKLREAICE